MKKIRRIFSAAILRIERELGVEIWELRFIWLDDSSLEIERLYHLNSQLSTLFYSFFSSLSSTRAFNSCMKVGISVKERYTEAKRI